MKNKFSCGEDKITNIILYLIIVLDNVTNIMLHCLRLFSTMSADIRTRFGKVLGVGVGVTPTPTPTP